jgi:hypothetical protein
MKKPEHVGLFSKKANQLLDFGFFEHNMLAHNGIVFFDLEFFGHGAFVFVGGVEITGTGRTH